MTIQDLGSIGEIIGAIATVATLLYLGAQIRANTAAIKSEALRSNKAHATTVNLAISQDKELASVFRRGLADIDSLDPDERIQFTFLFAEQLSGMDSAFTEMRAGNDDGDLFARSMSGTRHLLKTPGGRAHWLTFGKHGISKEFAAYLESEIYRGDEALDGASSAAQQSAAADSA